MAMLIWWVDYPTHLNLILLNIIRFNSTQIPLSSEYSSPCQNQWHYLWAVSGNIEPLCHPLYDVAISWTVTFIYSASGGSESRNYLTNLIFSQWFQRFICRVCSDREGMHSSWRDSAAGLEEMQQQKRSVRWLEACRHQVPAPEHQQRMKSRGRSNTKFLYNSSSVLQEDSSDIKNFQTFQTFLAYYLIVWLNLYAVSCVCTG